MSMFTDSVILITGGTGSWGQELTKQLLPLNPKKIIIFSRGELNQVLMQRLFSDSKIQFVIGDVRDYDALNLACRGVDYMFHLAALKHVPVCEHQPHEAIKTNITGTTNVINAAINNNVKKVIDVSTDKAVDPLNLYGMTKAVGERLIIQANELMSNTKFVCIRGGNVIGSNGSAIPLFVDNAKKGAINVTSFEMTRYFMTLPQAIGLLFKASQMSVGGETFVMKMPSYYIKDVAECIMDVHGTGAKQINETGIRPGEKIHETLVSRHEARLTYEYDNDYYVILPMINVNDVYGHYKHLNLPVFSLEEYASDTFVLDKVAVNKMLTQSGYI